MKLLGRWRGGRDQILLGGPRRAARKRPWWRIVRLALLAVAALMITTAAISYSNNKLRRRKTYMTIAELTDAVLRFHHDLQRYPESFDQLLRPPADQPPYLDGIPNDAWGNPFRYRLDLEPAPGVFHVVSCGPDGEPGTGDDIENL
ncbi:MAG: type II secretion system protein GspG [Deltaproteobacteria bacterium]|nr:type II secretion system protein GspG [Deltaproteobacteria bacterium]